MCLSSNCWTSTGVILVSEFGSTPLDAAYSCAKLQNVNVSLRWKSGVFTVNVHWTPPMLRSNVGVAVTMLPSYSLTMISLVKEIWKLRIDSMLLIWFSNVISWKNELLSVFGNSFTNNQLLDKFRSNLGHEGSLGRRNLWTCIHIRVRLFQ